MSRSVALRLLINVLVLTFGGSSFCRILENEPCLTVLNKAVDTSAPAQLLSVLSTLYPDEQIYTEELYLNPNVTSLSVIGQETKNMQAAVSLQVKSEIQKLMDEKSAEKAIETLVYPASGFDSATPFLVLPELRNVIGIDSHAFHDSPKDQSITPTFGPGDQSKGFTLVAHVTATPVMSDVLVGRIIHHFPHARIISVIGIRPASLEVPADRSYFPNGIVTFDMGHGTPVRSFLHVQASSYKQNGIETTANGDLLRCISRLQYQAILRKGSMVFFQQKMQDGTPAAFPLVQSLIANGGLWIDGDQSSSTHIPDIKEIVGDWGYILSSHTQRMTNIQDFGYGHVELIQFHAWLDQMP